MIEGYYREIKQTCFGEGLLGTVTSTQSFSKIQRLPAMSDEDAKNYLTKKHNLKTSDRAMVVTVQIFDFPESFDDYEEEMQDYWNADKEDREHVIVSEPEEFSFLVINDRTTTSE